MILGKLSILWIKWKFLVALIKKIFIAMCYILHIFYSYQYLNLSENNNDDDDFN